MSPSSLIDLLHPDSTARDVVILGSACPPYLCAADRATSTRGSCTTAAILVVPSKQECRTVGWLDRAADTVAELLQSDGVSYAIVERGWRAAFVRAVQRRGLVVATRFVHARHGRWSEYLIPCQRRVARHVGSHVLMAPTSRRAWQTAWSLPGAGSIVPQIAQDIGLVIRHRGARPLLQWIGETSGRPLTGQESALIRVKVRGDAATAVVSLFPDAATGPSTVLKAALSDASSTARHDEGSALLRIAAAAESAGAKLPRSHLARRSDSRWMLCLQALPGQPAATLLATAPERLGVVAEQVTTWLERWALTTRYQTNASFERLDQEILRPAAALAPLLTRGDAYVAALRAMCARATGAPLPLVTTHGDLSMSNVLLHGGDPIGIVDWECAREDGLPLTDFFYAATDAVAATRGYRNRTAAFVQCCDPETDVGRWVSRAAQRLALSLGIQGDAVRLLKHATMLPHAMNELRHGRSRHLPFREMVQHLCDETVAQQGPA